MKIILKQAVGIDVAQKELVVCLGCLYDDFTTDLVNHKSFPNTRKGCLSLLLWVKKNSEENISVRFVMEATGVYHEVLAYFLDENNCSLSVVLPNKISNYFKTLEIKTITDKTASQAIAQFGLERNLENWERPNVIYKKLKQLTRERDQIVQLRTITKNQLHAEQTEAEPNKSSIGRLKAHIAFLNKQELAIKKELEGLVKSEEDLRKNIGLITSITGIGLLTAATILGETNGFEMIRNRRQLASYAGFDIREKQSGTSVKGKPKISKRGNRHLRKCMHLPALVAIKHDDSFKGLFVRLVSKHGIKMKAAVAAQRKLLEMTYTIFKKQVPYDKSYNKEIQEINENEQLVQI